MNRWAVNRWAMNRWSVYRWSGPRVLGGAAIVVVLGVLGAAAPVLSGPGYEMALVAGLWGPSVVSVVACRELASEPYGGFAMMARALATAGALALLAYLVALGHGLVATLCDPWSDSVRFALGPGVGMLLASLWGAAASEGARRLVRAGRARAVVGIVLALVGPLGSAAFGLALFHLTPVVFAYDPFVGHFSGSLYDTVLSMDGLLSYRAASAATLLGCYVAALHLVRDGEGSDARLRWRSLGRPGLALVGGAAAMASLASLALGSELGHWQTGPSIREELGGELTEGRCHVIYDRRLLRGRIELLARDCDAHIEHVERWLEATGLMPVTAYVFYDVTQKQRLMGAAHTSIAKPWRREVYLHDSDYPHRILRHELVHVLAGDFGRGPFRIAGSMGGLLPNPGLIEGLAVAAAPREDDLSSDEWAAAMRRIDVLPRIESLFALAFFGSASATGYTAAGSFVHFVRARWGIATVKRWYGGEDLEVLTGTKLVDIEAAWWESLDRLVLSDAALHVAKARFDRPSVLERRCPHVVDERMAWANDRVGAGDAAGALAAYRKALTLDPSSSQAMFGVARCHERLSELDRAHEVLVEISQSEAVPVATRATALERLGDTALRDGQIDVARSHYEQARKATNDEDRLRTIDVKDHYAADDTARRAIVALLVGTSETGPDSTEAMDRIGSWRATHTGDGTPDYLIARQHVTATSWRLAAERLDAALGKQLPVERVEIEAMRLRLVVACALGDGPTARAMLERYRKEPLVSEARRWHAAALVERCSRE